MTNLRINKLLYFAQGWSLARLGRSLFQEPIEAWKYGPVVPQVYQKYKMCGKCTISYVDDDYDFSKLTEEEADILLDVAREYAKYTSPALVDLTHKLNSPWEKAHRVFEGNTITQGEMEQYFKSLSPLKTFCDNPVSEEAFIETYRDHEGVLVLPMEYADDWAD